MNAVETMRLFSDGRMSLLDTRALMDSMGFSREEFVQALFALINEGGVNVRVGAYHKGEMQAELYLNAGK